MQISVFREKLEKSGNKHLVELSDTATDSELERLLELSKNGCLVSKLGSLDHLHIITTKTAKN